MITTNTNPAGREQARALRILGEFIGQEIENGVLAERDIPALRDYLADQCYGDRNASVRERVIRIANLICE